MRLETAREAVHTKKSTPLETPRETVQARKSTPVKKNGENKKHKNGDPRRSPEVNNKKAKYTNFTNLTGSCEEVFLAIE